MRNIQRTLLSLDICVINCFNGNYKFVDTCEREFDSDLCMIGLLLLHIFFFYVCGNVYIYK